MKLEVNAKLLTRQYESVLRENERLTRWVENVSDVLGCDGTRAEVLDEIRRLQRLDDDPNVYSRMPRVTARAILRLAQFEPQNAQQTILLENIVSELKAGSGVTLALERYAKELEEQSDLQGLLIQDICK